MSRRRWAAGAVAAALLASAFAAAPAQAHGKHHDHGSHASKRVVGYFTQWGIYGRNFLVNDLVKNGSSARLTHINYAFGFLDEQGKCVSADAWADYQKPFTAAESVNGKDDVAGQPLSGNLNQLRLLKQRHPTLRVLISLGGWTGSKYFSNAALTAESRREHVRSCIDLWIKGNLPGAAPGAGAGVFDGIDLDWEWPGSEGEVGNIIRPEDKRNFTLLVQEYRKQLDRRHDLTAFLPASPAKVEAGFEVKKVFKELTFATVQGYDFHGTWESTTNQQSSLRVPRGAPTTPDFSSQVAVDAYLTRGAPKDKIVLGVPFYSQGWTGVTGGGNGLFKPAAGPAPGLWANGVEDYKVLAAKRDQFRVYRDHKAGHAWIFDGTTFWTYDDPIEMFRKARYIDDRRLGGAMIWSLDGDTTRGELIKALHLGLQF
ncbi:glycoside hydrolase family 18 protein [Actinokineospora guangxiensis]|uniref:chitinase n=1 Tax=Actinokineospora guangxiensis TaxID=1490288 RepID=A0ABW0ESX2_9PSEU